jgi:hypothetical protein
MALNPFKSVLCLDTHHLPLRSFSCDFRNQTKRLVSIAEMLGDIGNLLPCGPLVFVSYSGSEPIVIWDALNISVEGLVNGVDSWESNGIESIKISSVKNLLG